MFLNLKTTVMTGAIFALSACSGGLNDSFYQVDGTAKGNICIEGMSASTKGAEATDIVDRIRQYYGGTESTVVNVHSAKGYQATCALYQNKPQADVTIDEAYYKDVIVPATNGSTN
jgi:hypothetical protein